MPATIILTTPDPGLEAAWKAQLAPREPTTFARPADLHRELLRPGARVWIADINDPRTRHTAGTGTLVILVGQPHSLPFEQARQNRAARLFLSYDESRSRLGESVSLLEEVAEKNAQLQTALDRTRRLETEQQLVREPAPPVPGETADSWDFLESALEHLGDRDRLLDEFRRAGRYLLRAGKVLFFLRQYDAFVADREAHRCEAGHALPLWLEEHPAALDLGAWTGTGDPTLDSPIRQQLQTCGARVIVPLHSQSQLLGWIALGPRADGGPYREADRSRAVLLARLLERCLERHTQLDELRQSEAQAALRAKYLPGARLLTRAVLANADLPVEVRAVAGEALALKKVVTQPARPPHRFRVSAGPVPEIDGVWVTWEEAAPEIERIRGEHELVRRELLRNLGLTLSHELSNPLVSLVTFSQLRSRGTASPLVPGGAAVAHEVALASDVQKLQRLAEHASVLGELAAPEPQAVDLNLLLTEIAAKHGLTTRFSEEPLAFSVDPRLLRFAFGAIFDAISANRPDEGTKNLLLTLRASGTDAHRLAVITIEGKNLELDGVLPLPEPGVTPNQGRLSVFLAREILRLHGGTLHAGPGIKGTDIQISLGALR
ncbi:MAG TPA: hypothetical protein VEB66_10915 [Opitutaceae bacterium]|nr:hypothetical protein [Opitutaceae bacterium]